MSPTDKKRRNRQTETESDARNDELSLEAFHHHDTQRLAVDESDDTYVKAAQLFKALADPERLKLIAILSRGEACVSELASRDQMSTVSQRLKTLRIENLVTNKREGKHMIYSLADHHVFELIENALEHVKEKS